MSVITIRPRVISPDLVKAEAERRILAILPEYKQRNGMAWTIEMISLYGTNRNRWPAETVAQQDALDAAWQTIKGLRESSNALEAMDPIPADYTDDKYWI